MPSHLPTNAMTSLSYPAARPPNRRAVAGVAAAHALAVLGLWGAQQRLRAAPPPPVLTVSLVQATQAQPEPAAPLPAPAPQAAPAPVALPVPTVVVSADSPVAGPLLPTPPAAPPSPAPQAEPPPPPARAAAPIAIAPPAPAAPRTLPSSAVAYVLPPPIELPLASRRLGEQGTVWLRVRVGADGLPREVSLHRSSGHARLDEQALWAMKRARFQPQTENGMPIEWIVVAPLQYEID